MSVLDEDVLKTHDTDVLLYESHLKGYEGNLFARTVNDKVLTEDDVCVSAKERGGYTGSLEDLKEHTRIFLREMAFLLRDGYRINLGGIIELFINVGGWFANEYAQADPEKNKLSIHTRLLHGARLLVEGIKIVVRGLAPVQAYIAEIVDAESETVNDVVTKDGLFSLSGQYLEIVGDPREAGVFYVLPGTGGGPDIAVPVTAKLATNSPSKIVGKVPELLPDKDWYIEVRTYYSHSGKPLKELRVIRSPFAVRQV